jgi:hypothetical protein
MLLFFLLEASVAVSAPAQGSSYQHHIAQGRYLLEQGLTNQAILEFEAAALMPDAKHDVGLHFLLAHSYYEQDRVEDAIPAIRNARRISSARGDFTEEMRGLLSFLEATFTLVRVVGAGPEARLPEPVTPLLDPKIKRILEEALNFVRAPGHEGPVEVFLPVGAYRLGGHIVELQAERKQKLDLRATTGASSRAGVYGEGRSVGPPYGMGSLLLQMGFAGLYLQGEGAVWGRFLVGWMCRFVNGHLGLRFAGDFGARPIERLQGEQNVKTPLGMTAGIQLAAGPVFRPTAKISITPWIGWNASYAHPIAIALPTSYQGPRHYFVHGPDLEVLVGFLPRSPASGRRAVPVEPVVGLRIFLRDHHPLGLEQQDDARPHLTAGAGVEFGLRVGG